MSKTVDLEVHVDNMRKATEKGMEKLISNTGGIIGLILSDSAKDLCPVAVEGGGSLKQSIVPIIPSRTGSGEVTMGMVAGASSNVKYAVYQEYGTGYKSDCAKHTPKLYWRYKSDRDGEWHTGHPQKPRRFMRKSYAQNEKNIENLLAGAFEEVLL